MQSDGGTKSNASKQCKQRIRIVDDQHIYIYIYMAFHFMILLHSAKRTALESESVTKLLKRPDQKLLKGPAPKLLNPLTPFLG